MNQRTARKLKYGNIRVESRGTVPARNVTVGMRVKLSDDGPIWTVLEHHPLDGHWWLHRWEDKQWITTSARYSDMRQVVVA